MKHTLFFIPLFVVLFFVGCDNAPAGFPRVVPCTLTIVKDDVPLPQVTVMLITEGGTEWFVSGNSNESGIAEIQTLLGSFSRRGAPVGTYKVTLMQLPQVEIRYTQQELFDMSPTERAAEQARMEREIANARAFPVEFENAVTTPITIEVVEPRTSIRLNVSDWIGQGRTP